MVEMINEKNFEEKVLRNKKPVIVDFFANWCGPCRMMAPVFEALSKEYAGKVDFFKLDTEENQEISINYEIRGIPCLIIFKGGEEVERLVGYRDKAVLKNDIEKVLGRL